MRKPKANTWNIPTYHNFRRGHVIHNGKKYYGTFFTLSQVLTDETKAALLENHNNTLLYISQAEYTPEIKSGIIFCADNNLR